MGIVLPDFVLESVLRAGLTAIRSNPLRIDDLFSQMNEPYMTAHFGQGDINKIKEWVAGNRINITQGFPQKQSEIPCISINLQAAVEATELAVMNDYAQTDESEVPATVVVSATPTSWSATTKTLVIDDSVDLSEVNSSMFFVDVDGDVFQITAVNETAGNKFIQISIGNAVTPNISTTCTIVLPLFYAKETYNMIPIHEKLMMGIHTESAALTKYLYYLVVYILQIRRDTFMRRWMELTHFTGTDFVREPQFLPENIYSRYIILDAITRFYYKEEAEQSVAGMDIKIRVPRDLFPRDDEDSFNVITVPE